MATNPNQTAGKYYIKLDGVLVELAEKPEINPGGVERETVDGVDKTFFKVKHVAAEIGLKLIKTVDTPGKRALNKMSDVTLTILDDLDNSESYPNAWCKEPPTESAGVVSVTFVANPGEEKSGG